VNPWCTWTAGGTKWKCNLCSHETHGESAKGQSLTLMDLPQHVQVEPHYFSALGANLTRLDYAERPELQKGTVDFDVSQATDYWASNPPQQSGLFTTLSYAPSDAARSPQNMRYVFVLDVSDAAMRSGFLATSCVALRAILYGRVSEDGSEAVQACLPSCCSVALVTFDNVLNFYDLSVRSPS